MPERESSGGRGAGRANSSFKTKMPVSAGNEFPRKSKTLHTQRYIRV
jgi:hypothetical protein